MYITHASKNKDKKEINKAIKFCKTKSIEIYRNTVAINEVKIALFIALLFIRNINLSKIIKRLELIKTLISLEEEDEIAHTQALVVLLEKND